MKTMPSQSTPVNEECGVERMNSRSAKGMRKRYAIAITVVVILFLVALAVFQGRLSREVTLKRNGLPLANLKGNFLPNTGADSVSTISTDANGRLDLSGLPQGTDQILVWLQDGTTAVFNGLAITLPKNGSLTIDFRGSRTISTTKWTYFGLFTWQEVQDCVEVKNTDSVPSETPTREPLPDGGAKPTASPSSRPGS
jgi:hypothetical protein